ncbi:hypothetical protein HCN44_009537 [Aphidius gifuensis]|uniref:Uncharacterized protein n=1 Tax=Aphidius gifuensis TaxID=684658 RepID=A0A834Y6H1_APHGI|nr:hypothetical protein HCN44_009537 [Aphidius gifuensis]
MISGSTLSKNKKSHGYWPKYGKSLTIIIPSVSPGKITQCKWIFGNGKRFIEDIRSAEWNSKIIYLGEKDNSCSFKINNVTDEFTRSSVIHTIYHLDNNEEKIVEDFIEISDSRSLLIEQIKSLFQKNSK